MGASDVTHANFRESTLEEFIGPPNQQHLNAHTDDTAVRRRQFRRENVREHAQTAVPRFYEPPADISNWLIDHEETRIFESVPGYATSPCSA